MTWLITWLNILVELPWIQLIVYSKWNRNILFDKPKLLTGAINMLI